MLVIPTLFPKLQTVKDLVRPLSKKHRFRAPFDSQHVKGSQTLLNCAREDFHHFFHPSKRTLFGKFLPE